MNIDQNTRLILLFIAIHSLKYDHSHRNIVSSGGRTLLYSNKICLFSAHTFIEAFENILSNILLKKEVCSAYPRTLISDS